MIRIADDISASEFHDRYENAAEQFAKTLDAPSFTLSGSVEIDEVYVPIGLKAASATKSRARVVPMKSADESTVRLLLDNHEQELLTVYTDGFRAYDPLNNDDTFDRKYVVP